MYVSGIYFVCVYGGILVCVCKRVYLCGCVYRGVFVCVIMGVYLRV